MGFFALGVLWVGTLLVLLAAAGDVRRWIGLRRRMRPLSSGGSGVGLIAARVLKGAGPLVRHTVIQTGRWAAVSEGEPRAIIFHDREYRSEILGGTVETLDGSRRIAVPALGIEAEVWAPGKPQQIDPELSFEQAYVRSKHVRGFPRALRTELTAGSPVWLVGELRSDGGWTIASPPSGPLIVSTVDPRGLSSGKVRLGLAVMLGLLLGGVGSTALTVWPPQFGGRSIAGAVLCLAFFLTMQPIGSWLRNILRSPARALVRGTMVEDTSLAKAEASSQPVG